MAPVRDPGRAPALLYSVVAERWRRSLTALIIPDLEEPLLARLSAQAAYGCSVEEDARRALRQALPPAQAPGRRETALRSAIEILLS